MITWQFQLSNYYLGHFIVCFHTWRHQWTLACLTSHMPLERTTSWIHNRQVRKSRIPRPNWDESRFPESSLILFPFKIFSVFPNPAPCFGQFPDPENTLPDLKLWWDYPSFLTCSCGPFNGIMTHADVLNVWRSPNKRGVNRWTHRWILKIFLPDFGFKARWGLIRKMQPFFKDFWRTTLDFQGPPIRNIISQIVQKRTFPVYSIKALRLELFAWPTSLHFSVHLS